MNDLKTFELRYKELSDSKLLQLWNERNTLKPELVPVLKNVLLERKLNIIESEKEDKDVIQIDYSDLSYKELQEYVTERLQTGESIESIKIDLADHGINVMDIFNRESEKNENVYNLLAESRINNADDVYVNRKLKEEYGIEENEIPEYKQQMRSRAKSYITIGGILVFISVILLGIIVATDSQGMWGILALLGGGILLLSKGLSQKKV